MRESPRILIGTLYCGENEFEALEDSLQAQMYPHWEHVVYKNLPNKEAHDRLYRTFMDRQDDFDLFLKLDADMVFRREDGLRRIVDLFQDIPQLDHLTLAVRDWYSGSLIEGLHTFSDRVRWETGDESRFVDPAPLMPGERRKTYADPAPVVDHSPDPSPFQAFRFGVHRALKVVQRGRWIPRFRQAIGQWLLLRKCWHHCRAVEVHRLGLALLGAEAVFSGHVSGAEYDRNQDALERRLAEHEHLNIEQIKQRVRPRWQKDWRGEIRFFGVTGAFRIVISYLYDRMYG